jgi:hypothetical protein
MSLKKERALVVKVGEVITIKQYSVVYSWGTWQIYWIYIYYDYSILLLDQVVIQYYIR